VKGAVYQRGSKWYYKFRVPQRNPSTGRYPWITKGGYDTEREAWKACREAMREADRGRVVKPSTRTVAQFLMEWLTAVEPALDATTWRSWSDYARAYVIPHIGAERLQRLDEPALLKLYAKLLAEGRVKRDNDTAMYEYWSTRTAKDGEPTPRQVSEACNTTIHAARPRCGDTAQALSPNQFRRAWRPRPSAMYMRLFTAPSSTPSPGNTSPTIRLAESSHRGVRELAGRCGSPRRSGPSWPRCATTDSQHYFCWN
jgi:hypothetical protein